MIKYRNYIIITIILLSTAVFFFLKNGKGTLKQAPNYFAITDTSEIVKITIINNSKNLILEQSVNNWLVNGNYNANTKLIKTLFVLFSGIEIQAPVPKKLKQDVLNGFSKNILRIVFETKTDVIKDLEFCTIEKEPDLTFIRVAGKNDLFIIKIPGVSLSIKHLLITNDNFWRDKIVFRYKPWEILNIKVDYPGKPGESFFIDLANPEQIKLVNGNKTKSVPIQKDQIVRYLLGFNSVPYHLAGKNRTSLKDSLAKSIPFCAIKVQNIENKTNEIKVYAIPVYGKSEKIDLFKMYAVLQNDTNPVYVKYVDFDPLMKSFKELSKQ
jgi:hypothetical protein